MSEATQRWQVGAITLTTVVERQTDGIPPQFFFPDASPDDVRSVAWLGEHGDDRYARPDGTIGMTVQAFVVEVGGSTVLVDPCVGNGKARTLPFWHEQAWPWMERFTTAGFSPDAIDLVVHTHLHADHVGWDTHRTAEGWVPTFPRARHVYVGEELEFWRAGERRVAEDVYADSVAPILEAGLAEVVDADADLGHGLRLVPTPGHTPGHVSLDVVAGDDRLVVTGDLMHHPAQFTRTDLAEIGDHDAPQARVTRAAFVDEHGTAGTLLAGTHFPSHPVGRAGAHEGGWRFEAEPGRLV